MVDPATPPAVKVRAAEFILTHGLKAIEVEEIGLVMCYIVLLYLIPLTKVCIAARPG
jgi:hypothetical protein